MMRKTGNVERISINSVDKELTWVPGTSPNFDSYWGYAYPMTHDPGYIRTDTIVRGCLKGIVMLTIR